MRAIGWRKVCSYAAVAVALAALLPIAADPRGVTAGSLSQGSLTMVSANAAGTDSAPIPGGGTFGADQVAISEDGKVVAFVSKSPAETLVNDPVQLAAGSVMDTNDVEDVFVWDSRVPAPIGPVVTLVSWNATHTGAGGGNVNPASQRPIMAPGGLGIVFESRAKDLTLETVTSDLNLYAWVPLVSDVFPLFLVNENMAGEGSNSTNSDASIAITLAPPSAKVVFTSNATDLVTQPKGGPDQVYVRDFVTQTTTMVSLNAAGTMGTINGARDPMIAADGVHVVFESGGGDLQSGISGSGGNIWIRNLLTSSTTLVSFNDAGTDGTSGNGNPVISADGTAVAWDGNDPDLSPVAHNGNNHIFYRKGMLPVLMVDTAFLGATGCNQASNNPGLSLDGSTVAFESFCSDIVPPGVTDSSDTDVFVRRMGPVPEPFPELVSINDAGNASGNGSSFLCPNNSPPHCGASTNPGITLNADGSAVTFFSNSSDIDAPVNPNPQGVAGVFVRYPQIDETVRVTLNANGNKADGNSRDPMISADGGSVAFISLATDLVVPDTNIASDAFTTDLHNSFVIQPIAAVDENTGTVTITVLRTGVNGTTDTVEVETGDGSVPSLPSLPPEITNPANSNALEPGDYTSTTETLTFAPGETMKSFAVAITNDAMIEDPELFHVSLGSPTGAGEVALPGPLSQAYVVILDDDGPAQDWDVAITQQPPASAQVGDVVVVQATISVEAGASSLEVTGLAAGPGTFGFDQTTFTPPAPFTVLPGTSAIVTVTGRLTGPPGSAGNILQVAVTGQLGAGPVVTKTADATAITSTEAVTATLTATDDDDGDAATVGLADKITYTLQLTNTSNTAVQLSGLPAGLVAPLGTTELSRVDGVSAVAASGSTAWTLEVDVDDALADGAMITQAPAGVMYAMSAVGLAARPAPITPTDVVSAVQAPVVTVPAHSFTDVNGGAFRAGDVVEVTITVTNTGTGSTVATVSDNLTNLESPSNVLVDNAACGACSTTTSSVTAPIGSLGAGGSHTVTFNAVVAAAAPPAMATSAVSVSFAPATTGTSPTTDMASVAIAAENAPEAFADTYAIDEDQPLVVTAPIGVLANDTDGNSDPLNAMIVSTASAHGAVTLNADGSFDYMPDANYNGPASFTYVVNDGISDGNVATVSITVNPINDAPVAVDDVVVVVSDGSPVTFNVLANDTDVDGDMLAVAVVVDPLHGTVSCTPEGVCTYMPDPGYVGQDSFQYTISDGFVMQLVALAESSPATVQIEVQAAPVDPTDPGTTVPGGTPGTTTPGTPGATTPTVPVPTTDGPTAPGPTGPGGLPVTGGNSSSTVAWAAAALLFGLVLAAISRRPALRHRLATVRRRR